MLRQMTVLIVVVQVLILTEMFPSMNTCLVVFLSFFIVERVYLLFPMTLGNINRFINIQSIIAIQAQLTWNHYEFHD